MHEPVKTCSICKQSKPVSNYHKQRRGKSGVSSWCVSCRRDYRRFHYQGHKGIVAAQTRAWFALNPNFDRDRRRKIKLEMIAAYGGACVCCGESNPGFLTVDHIAQDGHLERSIGGGCHLYGRLKKMGWPRDRYQLLCYNCNCGRAKNGGVCPHEDEYANTGGLSLAAAYTQLHPADGIA